MRLASPQNHPSAIEPLDPCHNPTVKTTLSGTDPELDPSAKPRLRTSNHPQRQHWEGEQQNQAKQVSEDERCHTTIDLTQPHMGRHGLDHKDVHPYWWRHQPQLHSQHCQNTEPD